MLFRYRLLVPRMGGTAAASPECGANCEGAALLQRRAPRSSPGQRALPPNVPGSLVERAFAELLTPPVSDPSSVAHSAWV